MARIARAVAPGLPHHVAQRGNRGVKVFITRLDREEYLRILRRYAQKAGLKILAYCLMPDHVHLIVVPRRANSIARALREAHTLYSRRFNRRQDVVGHLWQGRFFSCALDATWLMSAAHYVEHNPVRAKLAKKA
jgi:putative transposase